MRTLYYFTLLALPCLVLAEADTDALTFSDQSYTDDLPIVLSATRLAQPISEAPVAMTVIDRDMIEASGARNIPDVLRLVPGMQMGYFDGNSPVVAYHGHSAEHNTRLQVLIDGRSVYEPARDAVPWSDLEIGLDDIDHIEVIRGPNASTFGNNSFLAVISITTRHAVEAQGHTVHFKAGSHATTDAAYTFGDQTGSLDYRITVTTENDNGSDLLRDETQAKAFNYRLDWQTTSQDRVMYQGGMKHVGQGDHEAVDENQETGHSIENSSAFQLIKWEHLPQSDNSFSLQYYYNRHETLEISPPQHVPALSVFDAYDYIMDVDLQSERHDLEFNHFLRPTNDLRLVWGSSARLDIVEGSLDGDKIFRTSARQELELYRGFAHGEWNFAPDWLLDAGYMVEYNDISGNDSSPRIALIHHINNQHTLRLSKSKATRTPTLFEEDGLVIFRNPLTINGAPPPSFIPYNEAILTRIIAQGNLSSEKITSTELGYIGEYLNNQLTLDITAFRDETAELLTVTDQPFTVTLPQPGPEYELNSAPGATIESVENELATVIRGMELSVDYRPAKNLRAYIFYSHLDIDSTGIQIDGDVEKTVPEDSGGMMLTRHADNNVDTSLMIYRYENFDWIDRNNERSADAYTKVDMRIAKHWQHAREKFTLALIGQNLLGTHFDYNKTTYDTSGNIENYGSPQDRRIYVELGLKFN